MNKYEAIIKAIELTDKLLDQDGISYDIASTLLTQRLKLINDLSKE